MNTNMSPDDACHDIEIIIKVILKIRVQVEPIIVETPEAYDRVSHAVKNLSIVTLETVSEPVSESVPAPASMQMSIQMPIQKFTSIIPNQPHQKNRFALLNRFLLTLLAPISALIFLTMTVLTARSNPAIIKS